MKTLSIQITAVFIFLTAPHACYSAAEPKVPLFDIIVGIMTKRTRAEITELENKTALEKITDLIAEYDQKKKPVFAHHIAYQRPTGTEWVECGKKGVLQTIAEHDIPIDHIIGIMGEDYHRRTHHVINENWVEAQIFLDLEPSASLNIDRALDPRHPGVWFVPGEIGAFLSLRCTSFDIKKANKEALALYKEITKEDQPIVKPTHPQPPSLKQAFKKKSQKMLTGFTQLFKSQNARRRNSYYKTGIVYVLDPEIDIPLPPVVLEIIFNLLRKTASRVISMVETEEGLNSVGVAHILLPSERVVRIMGENAHGHRHLLSLKGTMFESHNPYEMISNQLQDEDELAVLAATPDATFLVPSLAELLIRKRLTTEFYEKNSGLIELDLEEQKNHGGAHADQAHDGARDAHDDTHSSGHDNSYGNSEEQSSDSGKKAEKRVWDTGCKQQ